MPSTRSIKNWAIAASFVMALAFCAPAKAQLDVSKWFAVGPNFITGSTTTWCQDPANVSVSGGYLTLSEDSGSFTCNGHTGVPYSGSLMVSKAFSFTYGVVKSRVRFGEPGNVITGAVWLIGGSSSSAGYPATCVAALEANTEESTANCSTSAVTTYEIDVAEIDSSATSVGQFWLQWQSSATIATFFGHATAVQPINTGFHTYELHWYSDRLVYKLDDVVTNTSATTYPQPMFLLIDTAPKYAPTSFPATLQVDWIRVCSDPNAACQPGDPTMVFDEEFNQGVAAPTAIAHTKQGTTSQGVSTQ